MNRVGKGLKFGEYILQYKIGEGSTAEVWSASHAEGKKEKKAIKIFAPLNLLDDYSKKLIKSELKSTKDLNHPNIIVPTQYIEFEGVPAIVMPLCDNSMWLEYIHRKRLIKKRNLNTKAVFSEYFLLRLIRHVSSALIYINERKLVHNDIKPANILVNNSDNDESCTFFLSDFGITKEIRDTIVRQTNRNASLTFAYAAPEKLRGLPGTIESDIFSLGISVYELMSVADIAMPPGEILNNNGVITVEFPDYSDDFNALVRSMLKKDRSNRIKMEDILDRTNYLLNSESAPFSDTIRMEQKDNVEKGGIATMQSDPPAQRYKSQQVDVDENILHILNKEKGRKAKNTNRVKKKVKVIAALALLAVLFSSIFFLIPNDSGVSKKYNHVIQLGNNYYLVENKNSKIGIVDRDLNIVEPIQFDLGKIESNTVILTMGDRRKTFTY